MQCFIISPIGEPGSVTREHADAVFECIIEPALKKAAISGHRADHVKDVGRISKQMYEDILSSDFCIAVLHDFNPNVFYELAVAHCAGIPVIPLCEKGVDLPFDIKDERTFHYDLSPRAIYRGENVDELLHRIDSVRRLKGLREVPFGQNLLPLSSVSAVQPFGLKGETNAGAEYWLQLVRNAKSRLYLGGIAFLGWRGIPGMRDALKATAGSGCDIRVLTMDEENVAFRVMLNPQVTSGNSTDGRNLANTRAWFAAAIGDETKVRSLKIGVLFQQIIVSDDKGLISPYLYSANTSFSPCLEMNETCVAFQTYLREFDELWKANAGVSSPVA